MGRRVGSAGLCVLAVLAAWVAVAQVAQGFQPSERDATAARAAFIDYFAAVDGGDIARAHAMLSDVMRRDMSPAELADSAARFRAVAGATTERTIVRTSWYPNPP